MAELSLYLTSVNVSLGQTVDAEKQSQSPSKDFESVELGELGKGNAQKQKAPRRVIHFASGETMEEYSTDEEDEQEELRKKELPAPVEPSKLTWGPYFWFYMWRAATSTVSACDYLGERMASLFGITSPKYQYAIDEYYRMKKEEEEEEEENRMSEEAERRIAEHQGQETSDATTDQPEGSTSFLNVAFELEKEPHGIPDANQVPAPVSA
ncbi:protein FAM177A1-like isoform X1 [Scleropages formosus]|uniref:Protein FAM177A1-like n=1 Tax=Scleropages formosus TaxID=113540 RepID=A0A8C9UYN8_SCLFO|nr:protein FAM177A1-like isoform X1 [Scleropages formosus]